MRASMNDSVALHTTLQSDCHLRAMRKRRFGSSAFDSQQTGRSSTSLGIKHLGTNEDSIASKTEREQKEVHRNEMKPWRTDGISSCLRNKAHHSLFFSTMHQFPRCSSYLVYSLNTEKRDDATVGNTLSCVKCRHRRLCFLSAKFGAMKEADSLRKERKRCQ